MTPVIICIGMFIKHKSIQCMPSSEMSALKSLTRAVLLSNSGSPICKIAKVKTNVVKFTSKINIFVYITYACVRCIFI